MSKEAPLLPNEDQREFWSDTVGDIWVNQARAVDAIFAPILARLLADADLKTGEKLLDIGCGAGTSTFEAAQRVGPQGVACGVDISEQLLSAAQRDARGGANTFFVLADAQTHALPKGEFDCMISRFGVMFFADPKAAFRNIACALRPGGRLSFATWGAIPENPFFTLPAAVSKAHFGPLPKSDPDAPGPFSMRDVDSTEAMLTAAGLTQVHANAQRIALTPQGTAKDLADMMCEIGPAKSALTEYGADAPARAALIDKIVEALEVFATPQGLRIPAEINFFTAQTP